VRRAEGRGKKYSIVRQVEIDPAFEGSRLLSGSGRRLTETSCSEVKERERVLMDWQLIATSFLRKNVVVSWGTLGDQHSSRQKRKTRGPLHQEWLERSAEQIYSFPGPGGGQIWEKTPKLKKERMF